MRSGVEQRYEGGMLSVPADSKCAVATTHTHTAATEVNQGQLGSDVEELLSKELKSMSFKERLQIQEEIHGVADPCPPESPEMVAKALEQMQQHLDDILDKPIYDQ
ncbi:MAG: hypothetical protein SGILL_006686, partial [Bacillariaceae sp.]